jgi:hypothetical protein
MVIRGIGILLDVFVGLWHLTNMGTVRQRYTLLVPLAAGDEEATLDVFLDRMPEDAATALSVRLAVLSIEGETRTIDAEMRPVG